MKKFPFALALHGGAGAVRRKDYGREIAHMRGLVEAARDALAKGAKALDVAVETVAALEASGLYVAGRGASPNLAGRYELDASLMNGADGRAGAVAALQGFASPIAVARAVMEKTPHVMLVGEGATTFARAQGFAEIDKPDGFSPRPGRANTIIRPACWPMEPWAAWCATLTETWRRRPRRRACFKSCLGASATPR